MNQNMGFKVLVHLNLFVVVYGSNDPTNEEWLEYLAWAERAGLSSHVQLVVSDGGAPNFAQLRYLSDILRGQTARVAVVSSKLRVRAVVRVASRFNGEIKDFASSEISEAIDFLKVDRSHVPEIEDTVFVLRTTLRAP
jgi:hypothetical protein